MKIASYIFSFLLFFINIANAKPSETPVLDDALSLAADMKMPLLVDFYAPWCYSCYYMQQNVVNGSEWQALQKQVIVLELDADSPEGAAVQKLLKVKNLPSYVVLKNGGVEIGRVSGEQTRSAFYSSINAFLAENTDFSEKQKLAQSDHPKALHYFAEVLHVFLARREADLGISWFAQIPVPIQQKALKNSTVRLNLLRLSLRVAADTQRPDDCIKSAKLMFKNGVDCSSGEDVETLLACVAKSPAADKSAVLSELDSPYTQFVNKEVLREKPSCADARSNIFSLANLKLVTGDAADKNAVLNKAIAVIEPQVLKNPAANRNAADNLRVFYEAANRSADLESLLKILIAAYPKDYVYANRYARILAGLKEHGQAIMYFEQAAENAYGLNRLRNAQAWVQSLLAIKRELDARKVVADTLKANGPFFAEETKKLVALLPKQ